MRDPVSKLKWRMIEETPDILLWLPQVHLSAHTPPCSHTQILHRLFCTSLLGRIFLISICLCGAWNWTQGLRHAGQVLFSWATAPELTDICTCCLNKSMSYQVTSPCTHAGSPQVMEVTCFWRHQCPQQSHDLRAPNWKQLHAPQQVWGQATHPTSTPWKFA